jgi:hypothetical protein
MLKSHAAIADCDFSADAPDASVYNKGAGELRGVSRVVSLGGAAGPHFDAKAL